MFAAGVSRTAVVIVGERIGLLALIRGPRENGLDGRNVEDRTKAFGGDIFENWTPRLLFES